MNKGYYIKSRCIQDSWIAHAPPICREIFDYLIRNAAHTEKKVGGYVIQRGTLYRTYKEIREDLHWKIGYRKEMYHESSTKRAMKALMNEQMIELVKTPRGNLIKVLNYDLYQTPENYERTNDRTTERTNDRTKTEPKANRDIIQECKELKKGRKEKYLAKNFRRLNQIEKTPDEFLVPIEKLLLWWDKNINVMQPPEARTHAVDPVTHEKWDFLVERYGSEDPAEFTKILDHTLNRLVESIKDEKEHGKEFYTNLSLNGFLAPKTFSRFATNYLPQ